MPPAPRKFLIRSTAITSQVDPYSRDNLKKPLISSPTTANTKAPSNVPTKPPIKTTNTEVKLHRKNFNNTYASLGEFFKQNDNDQPSSSKIEDEEYPRPNIDLLASLLTLGKMIKQQKNIIRKQEQKTAPPKNEKPTPIEVTTPESMRPCSAKVQKNQPKILQPPDGQSEKSCTASLSTSKSSDIFQTSSSNMSSVVMSMNSTMTSDTSSMYSCTDSNKNPGNKNNDYHGFRVRNNMAARKSRQERRRKELETLDLTYKLEQENSQLISTLKSLTQKNLILEARVKDIQQTETTRASEP